MDARMPDERRRGGRGASNGGGRSGRRSDPYSRESRPNSTPQARPIVYAPIPPPAYPATEFSIRGSSGPTWIIVSNLVVGTSAEDVRLTFGSFGKVEQVVQRSLGQSANASAGFEVAFREKQDAQSAVDKFHGALADGRILQVFFKDSKPDVTRSQVHRATTQAAAQRVASQAPRSTYLIQPPAPIPYVATPAKSVAAAIPSAPASVRSRVKAAELIDPRAKKSNAQQTKKQPAAPAKSLAERMPQPLANRLLTPEQAQKVQKQEAAKKAKAQALAATGQTTQLGKRLGGMPLAQRFDAQAGAPKSDTKVISAAAEKKKARKKAKAAAKKATAATTTSMDMD